MSPRHNGSIFEILNKNIQMKNFLSLLTGVLAGAAIGVLLAPESGDKTREKLKKYGKELQTDLDARIEEGREKVSELRDLGEERMAEFRENTEQFLEETAKKVNSSVG